MLGELLTPREAEIVQHLLAQKGITEYRVFDGVCEGSDLPGSTYLCEISWFSATVETEDGQYSFLLEYYNGNYILSRWREKKQTGRVRKKP